jgi:signal recognition particle receptor subunit alpha
MAKDLGIIFVAVYQSLLQITYIDKLLDNVSLLFTSLFKEELARKGTSVVECGRFDTYYDAQIRDLEKTYGGATSLSSSTSAVDLTPPSSEASVDDMPPPPVPGFRAKQKPLYDESTDATPIPTPDTSRPSTPAINSVIMGKGAPKGSRRARKQMNVGFGSAPASSGDEDGAKGRPKMVAKGSSKKMRKWDAFGGAEEDDGTTLDYSAPAAAASADASRSATTSAGVDQSQEWGSRTAKGEYVLKDIGEEMDAILSASNAKQASTAAAAASTGLVGQGLGKIGGLFRNVVGGKTLTKEDLEKPLKGVQEHLVKKNVAQEAAVRLCESVEQDLVGMKTSSFTSKLPHPPSPSLTKNTY